jgi:hypothetical protein
MLNTKDINELWLVLRNRLWQPGYEGEYGTEAAFEVEVWKRIVALAKDLGLDVASSCLTSHAIHADRSVPAWEQFLKEQAGPDVKTLHSNNRLDIVFRHPSHGSIGIEVKCLGKKGHAGKLTQALGQALLGLWHRDRTIVAIHCGTVEAEARSRLREIGEKICHGTKTALVVVP